MKEIKIDVLHIENFKGIHTLTLDLHGKSAALYGDNATGKSSVYDALTWLLFGKDSHGSSKFNVKPLDASGNTVPSIMPTVTATLTVNGTPVTLRKVLREKWEKHRGGKERYAGNTVDYYVDDVPVKERDYKQYIADMVPEDIFRALTNTYHFCRDLSWKDRRAILFDLACVESDAQLLKAPQFCELQSEIGNRTVEEYKAMLAKKRRDANNALDLLPARIDECERNMDKLPESFDQDAKAALIGQIETINNKMAALNNTDAISAKRNEIRTAELALQALDAENDQHRRSQDVPIVDYRPEYQRAIERLERTRRRIVSDIDQRNKAIADADEQLNHYRNQWKHVHAEQYTGGTCPTCGQTLPESMEAAARQKFENQQKQHLDQLVSDSNYIKQRQTADKESLEGLNESLAATDRELQSLKEKLDHAEAPVEVTIEDLPDYAEQRKQMETQLDALRNEFTQWDKYIDAERNKLREQLRDVEQKKSQLDEAEADMKLRKSFESRLEELEQERRSKAEYIESIDEMLDLCEDFSRYKVERVSEAVNGRFDLVSFRLFTEAINGSLQDCCDPVVDGVPYSDLNNAMQINSGLDCIHTLSEFYGVSVPLFVDNAESVTRLYNMETQVIRLVVSEDDRELRCLV